MMRFIGRGRELEVLEMAYGGSPAAFIPIYGRRRVGKSELILHFLKNRPGVYFVGKQAPEALQIREFLREAAAALNEPLLASQAPTGWKEALDSVTERWPEKRKLVLALDEFQWIADASPGLPSVLQDLWDRKWSRSSRILLILCGSYVGFMQRRVLGEKSPLFGRRTAQILLQPFSYREAAEFHPGYSCTDQARTYFVCGGVPLYLNQFDDAKSVEANIAANLLNEYAPLFSEPHFLLREELRDVHNYYAILMALASGSLPSRTIARLAGIGDRALYYYLQQLEMLGYVRRRYPLTGEKPAARHVRFSLEDPLLRFWFRFIYPNTSFILQHGGPETLKTRLQPEFPAYWGLCFERLCREALPLLYRREGVQASFQVGEYWDKNSQIDVIGFRDDNWTDIGECKWGPVRSSAAALEELEARAKSYPNRRNASLGLRLFCRSAPRLREDDRARLRCHSLADLYAQPG